jgi:NTE family protein
MQNIIRVGGASAGAINALLLGLNYLPRDVDKIMNSMDFKNFLDGSFGMIGKAVRLLSRYGIYKGDAFREWIGDIIKAKTGNSESTFQDIEMMKSEKNFRSMQFIGTNLSTHFEEIFSAIHTPKMKIADAIRYSMSIPLFFAAKRNDRGDVYVDGGLLDNYPIKLFDRQFYVDKNYSRTPYYEKHNERLNENSDGLGAYIYNKETLGFRLDSRGEIEILHDHIAPEHKKINNLSGFLLDLIHTSLESQTNYHLHTDDWHRTIYIDTLKVKTTDFNITDKKKKDLIDSGRKNTEKYFEWYDDIKNKPLNRV